MYGGVPHLPLASRCGAVNAGSGALGSGSPGDAPRDANMGKPVEHGEELEAAREQRPLQLAKGQHASGSVRRGGGGRS